MRFRRTWLLIRAVAWLVFVRRKFRSPFAGGQAYRCSSAPDELHFSISFGFRSPFVPVEESECPGWIISEHRELFPPPTREEIDELLARRRG